MIGFMLKKWFFDLWDNLLPALVMNIVFVLPLAGLLFALGLAAPLGLILYFVVSAAALLLSFVFAGVFNRYTLDFTLSRSFQISQLLPYLKASWKPSLALGAVLMGLGVFILQGLPFYNSLNAVLGLVISVIFFWIGFFALLSAGYYWPLNAQFEPKIKKLAKKSLILMFDNPGFSLFLLFGGLVILVVSVITLSLFPGVAGLLLWFQVGLKLRMYKYDYLETLETQEPRNKIKIPWDTLLAAEREQVGPRSLKGMFFPWKE
jgi:uncharacterized membrane protein YesL